RGWVFAQRARLAWSALVLGQAWIVEGRPHTEGGSLLAMFESWSRVMGGMLAVAGIDGFLTNLEDFYGTDDIEGAQIPAFVEAWWDGFGGKEATVADLISSAMSPGVLVDIDAVTEQGRRIRLGTLLRGLRGRRYRLGTGRVVKIDTVRR